MIRLSVTLLDAWVGFVQPAIPEFEVSLEEFIAQCRKQLPATPQMDAGTKFHSVLERAQDGESFLSMEVDGTAFSFVGDIDLDLPLVRELSIEKVYDTPSGPVLLRGRVDGEDGITVTDHKLTFSTFDAERYADSLQWRAYLDMLGEDKRRFRYNVFTAYMDKGGDVEVRELHRLTFWRYPEMGEDVYRRVCELAEFVKAHVPELVTEEVAA